MPFILTAAVSTDPTGSKVYQLLRSRGWDVVMLAVDKIANEEATFSGSFKDGTARFVYGEREFGLDEIVCAWDWHANVFHSDDLDKKSEAVLREIQHTFHGLFNSIKQELWLNPPHVIRNTQEKISQMVVAQDCGLRIPPTVFSNRWSDVATLGEKTILKMPVNGTIDDGTKVLFTTILDKKRRQSLTYTSPFPGVHQAYIPKKREWRVTVVGEKIFPVAIYTKPGAKDDWRKHQYVKDEVRFANESLPDSIIEEKCQLLLRKLGLRYGAFDFIETPDGEMVFLEVNSAGQYMWLEDKLGLPISEAIADLLIEIANSQSYK